MSFKYEITEEIARRLLEMDDYCYGNSSGTYIPFCLRVEIFNNFPQFKKDFNHLAILGG